LAAFVVKLTISLKFHSHYFNCEQELISKRKSMGDYEGMAKAMKAGVGGGGPRGGMGSPMSNRSPSHSNNINNSGNRNSNLMPIRSPVGGAGGGGFMPLPYQPTALPPNDGYTHLQVPSPFNNGGGNSSDDKDALNFLSVAAGLGSNNNSSVKKSNTNNSNNNSSNNDVNNRANNSNINSNSGPGDNELANLLLGVRASTPNSAAPNSSVTRSISPRPDLSESLGDSSTTLKF